MFPQIPIYLRIPPESAKGFFLEIPFRIPPDSLTRLNLEMFAKIRSYMINSSVSQKLPSAYLF